MSVFEKSMPTTSPYPIPKDLSKFFDMPNGMWLTRNQLEFYVNKYLEDNKLMNHKTTSSGAMVFIKNDKFRKIFSLPEGVDEITYDDLVMYVIIYYVEKIEIPYVFDSNKYPLRNHPLSISKELCDFFNVPHGTKMSMLNAILKVSKYTFDHKLQVWDCVKNSFEANATLSKLFSVENKCEITYDDLATQLVKHFSNLTVIPLDLISAIHANVE